MFPEEGRCIKDEKVLLQFYFGAKQKSKSLKKINVTEQETEINEQYIASCFKNILYESTMISQTLHNQMVGNEELFENQCAVTNFHC